VPPSGEGKWSDDAALEALMEAIQARSRLISPAIPTWQGVLNRSWVGSILTGYCTTELRAVDTEFALLVESGLHSIVWLAAQLPARCLGSDGSILGDGLLLPAKQSFHRFFATYVGQYYLYGRIRQDLEVVSEPHLAAAGRIASEAMIFVLAHELAHAADGHLDPSGDASPEDAETELHQSAQEDEADALAAYVAFGDLWNDTVPRDELQLRLLGLRVAFLVLETVERCALAAPVSRHRTSLQRWQTLASILEPRLPADALISHIDLWSQLEPFLSFDEVAAPLPPDVDLLEGLTRHGWLRAEHIRHQEFWHTTELAVWQFRLQRPILDALIGFEICAATKLPNQTLADAYVLGRAAADAMVSSLPTRFTDGAAQRGAATSGDLMIYLRRRERWPEPFRSNADMVLPLHTMAAALARRIEQSLATD